MNMERYLDFRSINKFLYSHFKNVLGITYSPLLKDIKPVNNSNCKINTFPDDNDRNCIRMTFNEPIKIRNKEHRINVGLSMSTNFNVNTNKLKIEPYKDVNMMTINFDSIIGSDGLVIIIKPYMMGYEKREYHAHIINCKEGQQLYFRNDGLTRIEYRVDKNHRPYESYNNEPKEYKWMCEHNVELNVFGDIKYDEDLMAFKMKFTRE